MGTAISIGTKRVFTLAQAKELLGVIFKITKESSAKAEPIISQLEILSGSGDKSTITPLEEELNSIIVRWHEKVRALGAVPQGLWLVDFDCGNGFLCWKYPEPEILHWHDYSGGFTNRKPIEEWSPDHLGLELLPIKADINTHKDDHKRE